MLIIIYIIAAGVANSYLRRTILGLETAYVFSIKDYIMDRVIWAVLLGWATIPIAIVCALIGYNKKNT